MKKYLLISAAVFFGSFVLTQAATVLFVPQGGTGKATFTSSQLLYGNGTNALSSVATTSATCAGSVSCPTFNVLGASPITITGSGISAYDAFTHPFVGGSATTSEMISNGASTTRLGAYTAFFGATATSSFSSAGALTLITPLLVGSGGTGQSTFTASQLLYGNGTNALTSVATSTLGLGIGLSSAGSAALVGSSQLTLSIATSSLFTGTQGQVAYFSGTNTLVGTSSIFITTGGIVGIGTLTPSAVNANAKLTVAGIGSQDIIASTTDNTTLSDAIFNAYAPGSRVFLGAHGTNQVGTRYGITLGGWGEISAFNSSSGTTNGLIVGTNTATPFVLGTNNLERMRIASDGNVGIASTTPFAGLSVGEGNGVNTKAILVAENRVATSTTINIDARQGNSQLIRTGAAATTITLSNLSDGGTLKVIVCNPRSAAGAVTWASSPAGIILWTGGTIPTQTTTASKCDIWSFIGTGATTSRMIFGAMTPNF